ncbi:MAG: class I SAM-dependent methyltransferase [Methanosarcinaceae archaeon]|nr:class I SAM-dependent methyltransferase [Methanosarcinaceae archaeon]
MVCDETDLAGIVPEADDYAHRLYVSHALREPVLRSVIRALQLPRGSLGLDAGCGIGLPALLLAETVEHGGHVTGLDISSQFLGYAKEIAAKAGMSGKISFRQGDVSEMPFDDDTFDWVWSADCVGYAPMEPVQLLRELARVVKPGGTVAILAWSSQQLLPGYPLLEARLNATSAGIGPFTKGMMPQRHFLRALDWFYEVGLEEPAARTFVGEVQAPLSEDIRNALTSFFQMRWEGALSEVSKGDWAEYQRLCQSGSSGSILDCQDYYAFFTYTLFTGRVLE